MKRNLSVGDRIKHPKHGWFEVLELLPKQKVKIRFDDTGFETIVSKYAALQKYVKDPYSSYFHKDGETYLHPIYGEYMIIGILGHKKALVKFKRTGTILECFMNNIIHHRIKDPYAPIIHNVGYMGVMDNSIDTQEYQRAYNVWKNMLGRCYDDEIQNKQPTYKGCSVCKEWHCFSDFYKWYQANIKNESFYLDKDILVKGNKVYSPDTCCFVPNEVNVLFTKRQIYRGDLPIGVQHNETKTKYKAMLNRGGEKVFLGYHTTIESAFNAYKIAKEKWIKIVADKWKDQLDPKVYDALYNYQVEITD